MAIVLLLSGGEFVINQLFAGALILIAAFLLSGYILRDLFKQKKDDPSTTDHKEDEGKLGIINFVGDE